MNILGQYLIVSLGFVILAVIEFAIISHLNRIGEEKKKYENNKVFPELTANLIDVKTSDQHKDNSKAKIGRTKKSIWKFAFTSIHTYDLIAFLVHFISFLAYNIIYWYQNLYWIQKRIKLVS